MKKTYRDCQFGVEVQGEETTFRLFFPTAKSVECIVYEHFRDSKGVHYSLKKKNNNKEIWECAVEEDLTGKWYVYQVQYQSGKKPETPYASRPFADPYSRHLTVRNHYRQEAKTLIINDNYDWEGDDFVIPSDPRDLIIYETHIKDLVIHPSAEAEGKGCFNKWCDLRQNGGISHLKKLGVNAVEFLPLHKFPYYEPPYNSKTEESFLNSWNPYSRNYWGYMTSFFFAPESIYSSEGTTKPKKIRGISNRTTVEFKNLVKNLHNHNIAVIMDVVFNHTSLFDINPLAHHLPEYYLRKDEDGEWMNRSWTGNEVRSENPIVRKLITDSIRYWMEEYHIDGFRFDLAGLLDEESWDKVKKTATSVNPNVLLIAEPWGGRYVPYLFSNHGWSSWNDQFRNGIKGSNPTSDRGFIFSDWHHNGSRFQLENWFKGTIRSEKTGLFNHSSHSVNYLESHDGYTLGDFIRIAIRYHGESPVIENRSAHTKLNEQELRIAKLAAFCLFISQGIVMLSAGQEFARSKVIPRTNEKDPNAGKMDPNSYNKDDETNWIDFNDINLNPELFQYYRGLIKIRKNCPGLRMTDPQRITFDHFSDPLHVCFFIDTSQTDDLSDYYIAINGTEHEMEFKPPKGNWEVLANQYFATLTPIDFIFKKTKIPPHSAVLLRKLRH
ncbi:MAG: alpha-amylase family glycosyl hydrolase [Balneolaceae bacterium]